ncbi:Fe-S cluster assembly sulfur transfer protein SufU [Allofustis seminis]|uniref:Fe-S cluster assembly sulfur transfer protein SufU n=1 Tax=Allofustis seminis TaxID=166939 RepID=UPI00037B38FF|nr:SUF system NifU family Fe-S cluster assembly protein [Allofustis seminis]
MDFNPLSKLYRTALLEYSTNKAYQYLIDHPTHTYEIYNPSCGDLLFVQARICHHTIEEIAYTGQGCAISMASAHIMCKLLTGQKVTHADRLDKLFRQMLTQTLQDAEKKELKEAIILEGVTQFPMRIRCATLAWEGYEGMTPHEEGECAND